MIGREKEQLGAAEAAKTSEPSFVQHSNRLQEFINNLHIDIKAL